MTFLSLSALAANASQSESKGSLYGEAYCSSNYHSFQGPQRISGYYLKNRTKVLSCQVNIYSSQFISIIKVDELTKYSNS